MKKIFSLINFIAFSMVFNNLAAQDVQDDVYTPAGNPVEAWITEEYSRTQRRWMDDDVEQTYPNAILIDTYGIGFISSTGRFNCHGYAWYMTSDQGDDLNDPRWVGYYPNNTDEAIYWEDYSYVEVGAEPYPGKVSYDPDMNGDHSAITTGVNGVFISKWGPGPLAEHDWDDCPYSSDLSYSDLNFYKLCYDGIKNTSVTTNLQVNNCGYIIENITFNSNLDIDINFDEYVFIEGHTIIPVGTTLSINPN